MNTTVQKQVIVKLFVGCLLTSELRMHLKDSPSWQQLLILPAQERDLIETRFQQADYLGRFFDGSQLALTELKALEKSVRESIQNFCPKLTCETLTLYVFPQIFLP